MSTPIQVSTNDPIYPPRCGPYANASSVAETSTVHPLSTPMISNLGVMRFGEKENQFLEKLLENLKRKRRRDTHIFWNRRSSKLRY